MSSFSKNHPPAPPPPILSGRARTTGSRRSRSRSRTPPGSSRGASNRYGHSSRERDGRERGRRPASPIHYNSTGGSGSRPESLRKTALLQPAHVSSALPLHPPVISSVSSHMQQQHQHQSISLIAGAAAPPIIRQILNADEVKIPRRSGEGAKELFDRPDLKEAMLIRMRSDNNEDNPIPQVIEPPHQHQRVIAIIREPVNLPDGYHHRLAGLKQPLSSGVVAAYSSSRHLQAAEDLGGPTTGGSFRRSSMSPVRERERSRRLSPERGLDKKRDLLYDHRERERDHRGDQDNRERISRDQDSRSSRDVRERERYGGQSNIVSSQRARSRSPVRILRERVDRRSQSRSVTPPAMPPEIRRQFLERERERDLRNKLSRPMSKPLPSKFDGEPNDFRSSSSSRGSRGFIRGGLRGRGGFVRGLRSRAGDYSGRSRGFWEHDMFERDSLDQSGVGSKSSKDL